jgi:hypothetical protein
MNRTDDKGRTCDPALASVVATTNANANHHPMEADALSLKAPADMGGAHQAGV